MRHLVVLGTVAALALTVHAARADIIFSDSNTGGIGEVNILFETPQTGNPINGEIDHTGINTVFHSLTGQSLTQVAQGQADILLTGGGLLNSMDMSSPGFAYGDVILNLAGTGNTGATGVATITAFDNFQHSFTDVLKNGQNFVTLQTVAGTGEFITDVQVTMDALTNGWTQFKQPRVSGVCQLESSTSCVPVSVVEPISAAVFGSGLVSLALLRRRRR